MLLQARVYLTRGVKVFARAITGYIVHTCM